MAAELCDAGSVGCDRAVLAPFAAVCYTHLGSTMKTVYHRLNEKQIDQKVMAEAGEVIRRGGLVAFPTETVYGLGGDAMNPQASARIYAAKGRPSDNPLIVHIADLEALEQIAAPVPKEAYALAERFWPGPLTMILAKKDCVPNETTGGLSTVAIRMPDHPIALELIRVAKTGIAAPSANLSGRPSPTKAEHVKADLDGRIDMILDGGPSKIGLESTIVDLSTDMPMILRPGYIPIESIREVTGRAEYDPAILRGIESKQAPKAPGMKYKHYAPKGELTIVSGEQEAVTSYIREQISRRAGAERIGVIATQETCAMYEADLVCNVGPSEDEEAIARHLYSVLRAFDEAQIDRIYSEAFRGERIGQAIMNRLIKAAGHHMIEVS